MKRPALKLCRCAAAVLFAALLAALFAGCIRIGDRVTCTNCHGRGTVTCRCCLGLGK